MLSRDVHDRLVTGLYSSAAGETPWAATMADVAGSFASGAIAFSVHDAGHNVVAAQVHGYTPDFAADFYASGAHDRDPRVAYFNRLAPGTVYYDNMLYDAQEMARDVHVRATIDALKVEYQLGAVIRLPDGARATFAILSTPQEGHASASAIRAFRRLAPHLEQACALGQILEREICTRTALLAALSCKADGVILLDCAGVPCFMNDAAAAMLAADDGLRYAAGDFVTRRAGETRKLRSLIAAALAPTPAGHMLVTRPSGRRPYVLRVLPAPRLERFLACRSIGCVIHLQDLAAVRVPTHEALNAVFGLTERETDLAIELVRCTGLECAAVNAGMALNTARNHLHSIFRKTATASQAEAVQLLGRLF